MKRVSRVWWFFSAWAGAVILVGGILTSYHQPFLVPEAAALQRLFATGKRGKGLWQTTHFLSGSCECSRRVMLHLLERRPLPGLSEQVVLVDDGQAYLPDTADLLNSLKKAGFSVVHVAYDELVTTTGVRGVPLLLVSSPLGNVAYLGGYGAAGDQDEGILHQVRSGSVVPPLPVLGCAVGKRTKRSSDPFRLKY